MGLICAVENFLPFQYISVPWFLYPCTSPTLVVNPSVANKAQGVNSLEKLVQQSRTVKSYVFCVAPYKTHFPFHR